MSNCIIRRAEKADETFLWEMLYHALYVAEGQPSYPKEVVLEAEIAKYVNQWGKKGDEGYIAVDKVTLQSVGAIWIRTFTEENQGYGYIDDETPELSIAILPAYRNQGIGTALIDDLISITESRYPRLSLSVSVDNPAVRLYKRFGFEVVEQREQTLTMIKELRQRGRAT